MHRCLDDELVVRLAAGLVPMHEAQGPLAELEGCVACRTVLLEAAMAMGKGHPSTVPLDLAFEIGTQVAERYRVLRFVGRGGMGEVYEVLDQTSGQRLALKSIRLDLSSAPEIVVRFKQELRLARKVVHPNVCRVFDWGSERLVTGEQVHFFTLEFIQGQSLASWMAGQRASVQTALRLGSQLASGLASIHAEGIVHRDVKPGNVLVRGLPQEVHSTLLDFGIARSRDRVEGLQTTGAGVRLGTPDYMAPELLGGAGATPKSDLFSLGLVLYQLLTGKHPCPDPGTRSALSALGELKMVPIAHLRSDVPHALAQLIDSCLENAPMARPASAAQLTHAFQQLNGSAHARL